MPGGDEVHIDLGSLGTELKDLDRVFATAIRKQVRAAVADAGADLLGKVRAEASWSTRIPRATKLTTSFSARKSGITIRTSAAKAPHARPLEQGNQNGYDQGHVDRIVSAGGRTIAGFNRVSRRKAMSRLRSAGLATRGLRHPVFGRDHYTVQPTRPYLFPTVDASTAGISAAFQEAIDRAVREAGFH